MNNYILLIAWSVAGCSLAAVLLIYWRYRRMVRHYNKDIAKSVHEHDRLTKELEHARIERDTMEKLLETYFAEETCCYRALRQHCPLTAQNGLKRSLRCTS